jgi:hypothetical protein
MTTHATTIPPQPSALFDPEDLLEWVVEVDEVFLNSTGAQDRAVMDWWYLHCARPGLAARLTELAIVPTGALVYVRCDSQEEATWLHDVLVEKGLHAKGVTVRRLGVPIRCAGCDERRPFWATARRVGRRCRPCWDDHFALSWPGGTS